jgi:hypothetical protein
VALLTAGCTSDPDPAVDSDDSQAFCLRLRAAVGESSAVNQIDLADPASIDAAILQLGQVRELAPPSVADDVATVVDAFTLLVEALEVPDNRTPATVIAEQAESLAEATAAGERLQVYGAAECNVDLAPPAQPTPTPEADEDLAPA